MSFEALMSMRPLRQGHRRRGGRKRDRVLHPPNLARFFFFSLERESFRRFSLYHFLFLSFSCSFFSHTQTSMPKHLPLTKPRGARTSRSAAPHLSPATPPAGPVPARRAPHGSERRRFDDDPSRRRRFHVVVASSAINPSQEQVSSAEKLSLELEQLAAAEASQNEDPGDDIGVQLARLREQVRGGGEVFLCIEFFWFD